VRQLISDGRLFVPGKPGQMELVECGETPGNNACLSEIQAAILLGQLTALEAQNRQRALFAAHLDQELVRLGWTPQRSSSGTSQRTYYQYVAAFDPDRFPGATVKQVACALSAELNCSIAPIYTPLHRNALYQPERRRRWLTHSARSRELALERFDLPVAEAAARTCIAIPHARLLGSQQDMDDIVAAFAKVGANAEQVQWIEMR
jgi:dTDP-4-amino-4,6-dideoxygalactose transaminase